MDILFDLYLYIELLPGIKEILQKLNDKSRFFILTNCSNDLVKRIDIVSNIPVKIDRIFTSEDNGFYKPNPKSYQIVVDYIKKPINEIIYCTSNKWDLEASKDFGFNSKSMVELKGLS